MRPNRSAPYVLVSGTVGTTFISILAAWVVSSLAVAPVMVEAPATPGIMQSSPHHLYQSSPIPAGADWIS
jgi:hypothetical protein